MQYAVIKSGGKQYKVRPGQIIEVDKIDQAANKQFVIEDVLLVVNDGKVVLGKPKVSGAKVLAKLIEQKKGAKIRVMKYKAKVRYRRTTGFRPQLSVIEINKIDYPGSKTIKTAPKTTKE